MEISASINLKIEEDRDLLILTSINDLKKVLYEKPNLNWKRVEKHRYKILFRNGDVIGVKSVTEVYDLLKDMFSKNMFSKDIADLYAIYEGDKNITGSILVRFLSE